MNNIEFINSIANLYTKYLNTHRRSPAKLLPFHGKIAEDLQKKLGNNYIVKSLGFQDGKESNMPGRYMNKKVDISVFKKEKNEEIGLGGIAIKSIMTNYSQNSNNYFESMLGETANLRSSNKLYFHIVVLPEKLPYFGEKKINNKTVKDIVTKIEHITNHNLEKYIKLSNDNISEYLHSPNKTLLYIIKTTNTDLSQSINMKREEWIKFMRNNLSIQKSSQQFNFGNTIIYNDYEKFIEKVTHAFLSI